MVNPDVIPDDFPAWMRPRRRTVDWGMFSAALLGLVVGWAFFVRLGIPAVTVGTHTGFMASDFATALREGVAVPLWSPHALNGYGAPIPQFTAQGAAYLTALIEVFFTDNTAEAMRVVMVGALVVASTGMYALITAWGLSWGIVAAALYVLSPFVGLTAPHVLADPALMLAHALLPVLMWIATHLQHAENRWLVVAGAGLLGAFGLIEPRTALMCWLGGVLLLTMTCGRAGLTRWVGIGLSGAGMTCPLWLPALLWSSDVTWLPSALPSAFTVSVWEWLTPIRTPAVTPQFTMGLLLPILIGVAWLHQLRGTGKWPLLPVGTIMLTISALGCWLYPAPWWLCAGSFWAATSAIGALSALDKWILPERRRWAQVGATASVFALSLPVLLTPSGATTSDFSTAAQLRYEQRAGSTALLPYGYAIPSTLPVAPVANPLLLASYELGAPNRIPNAGGARVSVLQAGSHSNTWQISMVAGGKLPVEIAYFPAWFATLNDSPIALTRHPESGLMQLTLPPTSNGMLRLQFGLTALQGVAWLMVILTGLLLGGYVRRR